MRRFVLIGIIQLFIALALQAQYFGQNKVQYEDYGFKILETKHFKIHYYNASDEAISIFADQAEDWYSYLSEFFYHQLPRKNPVILYADDADFYQNTVISSILGEGTGGVTESVRNRIVIPFNPLMEGTDHVFGHELVHAFQYSMLSTNDSLGIQSARNLPLWLVEGMSEYLSIGNSDVLTASWMRDAVLNDDIPTIKQLSTSNEYFPYRYGHSLIAFIAGKYGDEYVGELLLNTAKNGVYQGIFQTFGISVDSLSTSWKIALEQTFRPQIESRNTALDFGTSIFTSKSDIGKYNIAPVLSPDGNSFIFFSERNVFTFDLFLADANTGTVIRKLLSSEPGPHFNAIRFLQSAGSWSPDSKKIAIVTFSKGNNSITILDAGSGKLVDQYELNNVGTIYYIDWSPDGKKIIFSGMSQGNSNLYLLDLETRDHELFVKDEHYHIQPVWSPKSDRVAYVTEKMANDRHGQLIISIKDLKSGEISTLQPFDDANHLNPQFSSDGLSLYFVSDKNGFNEIYRQDLLNDQTYEVTKLQTAVTGITVTAPSITTSRHAKKLFYTVYHDHKYNIYAMSEHLLDGNPIEPDSVLFSGDALPPLKRTTTNKVDKYLSDMPYQKYEKDTSKLFLNYYPRLQLDRIGNVSLGVGVNSYGVGVVGGVSLRFSDMLNERILYTAISANGTEKDISAQVAYFNQDKRLIKGAALGHYAFLSVLTQLRLDSVIIDDEKYNALVVDHLLNRTYNDQVDFVFEYPFSKISRLESGIGIGRIYYDVEVISDYYVQGFLVGTETGDLPAPGSLWLFNFSQALVNDRTHFGMTAPLKGSRYRLEVGGIAGSLAYLNILADYRKYFYVKPFSLAYRILHYGRYFKDAEDPRLFPLYIGYGTFVRGYGPYSFDSNECIGGGECIVIDRLIGSRILVNNFEIRYPLVGISELAPIHTNTIPITFNVFLDMGMAWFSDDPLYFSFKSNSTRRTPVLSTGASIRMNVVGAAIVELYYAYPFQRPIKGGHIGVVISPGW